MYFFFCRLNAPSFMEAFPLYSLFLSFHLSLPLVRLNITFQASFPHKCSQLVRCRAFNMVVVVFFSDISQFTIVSSLWSLSSKAWLPLAWYLPGGRAPDSHIAFRGSLAPRETSLVRCYRPCPQPINPLAFLTAWPSSGSWASSGMPTTQYSYSVLLSPQ